MVGELELRASETPETPGRDRGAGAADSPLTCLWLRSVCERAPTRTAGWLGASGTVELRPSLEVLRRRRGSSLTSRRCELDMGGRLRSSCGPPVALEDLDCGCVCDLDLCLLVDRGDSVTRERDSDGPTSEWREFALALLRLALS